ncbi:uncharacterized protein LOC142100001 [Mixophyes fleayi]|uniref:uncharacterized protein LOC142100001 n=1 Tax=Mixophyes fleayi TaxID=3061075 RepID=UPI003F4D941F
MTAENAHRPPREDDMTTDGTVTPTDNSRRAKNITDHKNSSREKMCNRDNLQNTTKVSLSIEDEMKKSDVKIITVKQKTVGARVERVNGETHPDSYRIHDKFIFFNTLSDLQRNLTTNSNFYSTCQGPAGNTRIGTGTSSILQNNMGCNKHTIKTNKSILQTATLKRNNADKGLLSDKVVIHFLSADGTKQKVDFAKHGNISKEEQIKSNRKTYLQEAKPILQSLPTREMKDEPGHVGPIINGMNPKEAVDINPSTRSRSHQASRSFCPSSVRATSSRSLRLNSVGEMPKWSYISISKQLSSPDNELSILQSNNSDSITSDVTMDIVRPDLGTEHDINCSVPLKTRPVVLENRKERRGSVPAEVNALGTGFEDQSTTGCSGEETETESGEILELGSVRSSSPSVIELSGMKSAKNDSNEEQLKKASPTQVYVVTMPVISIPTAPIDTSE